MYLLRRARRIAGASLGHTSLRPVRRRLRSRWNTWDDISFVDWVHFGSLRRLTPISRDRGDDCGGPIDRYYINGIMSKHLCDTRGRVLETAEGDLTDALHVPDDTLMGAHIHRFGRPLQ